MTMTVKVTATKADWASPQYELEIDGRVFEFRHEASRLLTKTDYESSHGIFSLDEVVEFTKISTNVYVDFGDVWDPAGYPNPAEEIARRVLLVREAFEAVRESYEHSWTVTI